MTNDEQIERIKLFLESLTQAERDDLERLNELVQRKRAELGLTPDGRITEETI